MKVFLVGDRPARHFSTIGVGRRLAVNRRNPVAAVVGATHQPQPLVLGHRALRRAGVDRANRIRPWCNYRNNETTNLPQCQLSGVHTSPALV